MDTIFEIGRVDLLLIDVCLIENQRFGEEPDYCRVTVGKTTVRQKLTSFLKPAGSIYPQVNNYIKIYLQIWKTVDILCM